MSGRQADEWHTVYVLACDPEYDDPPDYTLRHPDACQFEDDESGTRSYLCWTTQQFSDGSANDDGPTVSGIYQVRAWSNEYSNGPAGVEYDGGLEWKTELPEGDS